MKKIISLYTIAIVAILSGLFLYYHPPKRTTVQKTPKIEKQTFKAKTVVHDFGSTELKSQPKRIVILDNLYGEILLPLGLRPVGATSEKANSLAFAPIFQEAYKEANVVSLGWQGEPDLKKIADLKPDLILMTVEQKDFYKQLAKIAPTVGYQMKTEENWDYREAALKVADIFNLKPTMQDILSTLDVDITAFSEKVQAKYGDETLMYLQVTDKEIRYYAYGHFGYLYDNYLFNRAEDFDPDEIYEVITPERLKELDPDLLIVEGDSPSLLEDKLKKTSIWKDLKAVKTNKVIEANYATYALGFGVLSQEAIMKQIADAWDLN